MLPPAQLPANIGRHTRESGRPRKKQSVEIVSRRKLDARGDGQEARRDSHRSLAGRHMP